MNKPRLIDANDAKKLICGIDSEFAKFIDKIPTAYDIDKVVEQLEHDIEDLSGLELMSGKFAEGYASATKNHIEIVKGGVK